MDRKNVAVLIGFILMFSTLLPIVLGIDFYPFGNVDLEWDYNLVQARAIETIDFNCTGVMDTGCINPSDVNDIDKDNIEGDMNTFVDIGGDHMSGLLEITTAVGTPALQVWAGDTNLVNIGVTGSIIMENPSVSTFKISEEDGNWVINAEVEDTDDTGLILATGAEKLIKLGVAAGHYGAVAVGTTASAIGDDSIAIGFQSRALADQAFALGTDTTASGQLSMAMGYHTTASGVGSFAAGSIISTGHTTASGQGSIAIGLADGGAGDGNHFAAGVGSIILGINNKAFGRGTVAIGESVSCYNNNQVCLQDLNVFGDSNFTNIGFTAAFGNHYGTWLGDTISPAFYTDTNAQTACTNYPDVLGGTGLCIDLNVNRYLATDVNAHFAPVLSPTFLGDSNFTNLQANNAYFGNINISGATIGIDSNFTNVGISTGLYGNTANFTGLGTFSSLAIDNNSGTDAVLTMDGTSNTPTTITWESDNSELLFSGNLSEVSFNSALLSVVGTLAVNTNLFVANEATGKVGIGTASPQADLHYVGTSGMALFEDVETDNNNKRFRLGLQHYDTDEEPFIALLGQTGVNYNLLDIGGGTSLGNAATSLRFWTAANNTTPTGSIRMSINSIGDLTLPGNAIFDSVDITEESVGYQIDGDTIFTNEGNNNLKIGFLSGIGNGGDVPSDSLFIGSEAGRYAEANANIFIGTDSGRGVSGSHTGVGNTAIGTSTLRLMTSASRNTAIGVSALTALTTSADNVAIGQEALSKVNGATAQRNTVIGNFAMLNSIGSPQNNVAIGYLALQHSDNHFNTVIGSRAAELVSSSVANNVFIGYLSGRNAQGNANVFIGNRSGIDETGTNTLIIDNEDAGTEAQNRDHALIYGLFEDHTSGPSITINGDLKVTEDLNVVGTAHFDGNFSIKRETDSQIFICGIDATGNITCN